MDGHHHLHLLPQMRPLTKLLPIKPIVVVMGATGTGKTKLSIDIASRYASEVVNSDKIQVYRGLDITTNKVPLPDRRGVRHHLLGSLDPSSGELSAASFRSLADAAINSILSRGKTPVVAGGSNSFIQKLVSDDDDADRFRYRCCFLWVDVEAAALREYLDRRVEQMVGSGMVEELEGYFGGVNNKGCSNWERNAGLNKAIGVEELQGYFGKNKAAALEEAVGAVKRNTWRLAEAQASKIRRLGEVGGWDLRRVDATEAVRARLRGAHREAEELWWTRNVAGPAFGAVEKFLEEEEEEEAQEEAEAECCC